MRSKVIIIAASLWMGLLCLTACGGVGERTYQYPETAVLFDDFHIKKTVYSPGIMKLYYRGGQLKDDSIRCYDANFEDLGDQFEASFKNGVLTVKSDFAEQISGLTIEDREHDAVYHLRYLDSPQFAWLADTFWLDYGVMTLGDEEAYYTAEELAAMAEKENIAKQEILNIFAVLEGTWVSEDGMQKYVFSADEDDGSPAVKEMWYNEAELEWVTWSIPVRSAFRSESYNAIGEGGENLVEFCLIAGEPSSMELRIFYDPQENMIRVYDTAYYRTASRE